MNVIGCTRFILIFALFISFFTKTWIYGEEMVYLQDLGEKVNLYVDSFVKKDKELQNLEVLPEGQVYIPPGASMQKQEKLKRIAIYDVGSTGIKFKIMDVDPVEKKIVNVICG